jgi:hypothetical protein
LARSLRWEVRFCSSVEQRALPISVPVMGWGCTDSPP